MSCSRFAAEAAEKMSFDLKPKQYTGLEKLALNIGVVSVFIPAIMVSGFIPAELNVLDTSAWVAIAIIGSIIAGIIGFPRRRLRGSIASAITGGGALIGILLYVYINTAIFSNRQFAALELLIGAGIGSVPGIVLINRWVTPSVRH